MSWAESYPPGILADQVALVALYQSAGGEDWADNSNWLTGEPVDQWHGVTSVNGRVTGLDLRENLLSGKLPPALGNLANLETLVLRNNELGGEIPPHPGRADRPDQPGPGPEPVERADTPGVGQPHRPGIPGALGQPVERGHTHDAGQPGKPGRAGSQRQPG